MKEFNYIIIIIFLLFQQMQIHRTLEIPVTYKTSLSDPPKKLI